LKSCLNNHVRGLVHRFRFTVRRTGRKVPERGSKEEYNRSFKPEVSLDAAAEDEHLNRAIERAASATDSRYLQEFDDDMGAGCLADYYDSAQLSFNQTARFMNSVTDISAVHPAAEQVSSHDERDALLTPVEFLVYRQLTRPNNVALTLATVEATRGHSKDAPIRVDINVACLAEGIGMSVEEFERVKESLQKKITKYHNKGFDMEQSYHTTVIALERFFDVHVPRTADSLVVKRIFTLKARADYKRITPEIVEQLKVIGARVPVMDESGAMNCHGVLWQQFNQTCQSCDLQQSCRAEAANFGLAGEVAISPKLLPAVALVRTAVRMDKSTPVAEAAPAVAQGELPPVEQPGAVRQPAPPSRRRFKRVKEDATGIDAILTQCKSSEDEQLIRHLEGSYHGFNAYGNRYYTYQGSGVHKGSAHLFWVGVRGGGVRVRFVKCSESLKTKLEKLGLTYYLPKGISIESATKLLDRHATDNKS
jgi:hypothetical protein